MQFKSIVFLSILSILFLTGCDSKGDEKQNEIKIVEKITTYKASTINNTPITFDIKDDKVSILEHPNKIILINFFATWCPPCKAEIPNLVALQKKYNNELLVVSVLLEKDKTNNEIKEFNSNYDVNYIVVNDEISYDISKALGSVKSIPTMFLVDKNSKIYQKYVGVVPNEMMEIDIKKVLE
jgi:thiol-disulfide isomerase/thioredoxin